jgi:cysteine-rich repeat protein
MNTATCNGSTAGANKCKTARCGDGYTNSAAGEQCDGAGQTASCNTNCTTSLCGDGIVNVTAGEQCDDGNTVPGDGCSATCRIEAGFACVPPPPARSFCSPICGDGVVAGGEACDDGNNLMCGTCSAGCTDLQPVAAASGSLITQPNSGGSGVQDQDTFTLSDGVHTAIFEFQHNGGFTATHVEVDVTTNNLTDSQVADAIIAAINAGDAGLTIVASKAASQPYVQLINTVPGSLGNVRIVQNSGGVLGLFGMIGGAARDCPNDAGCMVPDDCDSGVCTGNKCQ